VSRYPMALDAVCDWPGLLAHPRCTAFHVHRIRPPLLHTTTLRDQNQQGTRIFQLPCVRVHNESRVVIILSVTEKINFIELVSTGAGPFGTLCLAAETTSPFYIQTFRDTVLFLYTRV
jgi:hypothetical protein